MGFEFEDSEFMPSDFDDCYQKECDIPQEELEIIDKVLVDNGIKARFYDDEFRILSIYESGYFETAYKRLNQWKIGMIEFRVNAFDGEIMADADLISERFNMFKSIEMTINARLFDRKLKKGADIL